LGTTLGRACSRGCRERKVRSKIGWLAGSRDSHHVSRFAAFFILARAEISVDGSCFGVFSFRSFVFQKKKHTHTQREGESFFFFCVCFSFFRRPSIYITKEVHGHGVCRGPFPLPKKEGVAPTFRIGLRRDSPSLFFLKKKRKKGGPLSVVTSSN
jgi:hypothetical protein